MTWVSEEKVLFMARQTLVPQSLGRTPWSSGYWSWDQPRARVQAPGETVHDGKEEQDLSLTRAQAPSCRASREHLQRRIVVCRAQT